MTSFVGAVTGLALALVSIVAVALACAWPGPGMAGIVGGLIVGLPVWWIYDGWKRDQALRHQKSESPKIAWQGPIVRDSAPTPPSALDDPTWID